MPERILKPAHPEQIDQITRFIVEQRLVAYTLESGTPAYRHMVDDMLDPDAEPYKNVLEMLTAPRNEAFARIIESDDSELITVGLGQRGERYDKLEHLFVHSAYQGIGYGRRVMRGFNRWSVQDEQTWIVGANQRAFGFYRHFHFEPGRAYTNKNTGISFLEMIRRKPTVERKAAA